MAKYTRKELEAMAIDLEIDTMGLSTKAQLADAVFEAKRMMKEIAAEAEPAEKAAEAVPAEKAAEAVPAEKVTKVKLQVSGKGVLAMRAAIEDESLMIQKAGQNMRQEGAEQMRKAIEAQVKENQRSIKNFDHGVEEIRTDIDEFVKVDLENYVRDFYYG